MNIFSEILKTVKVSLPAPLFLVGKFSKNFFHPESWRNTLFTIRRKSVPLGMWYSLTDMITRRLCPLNFHFSTHPYQDQLGTVLAFLKLGSQYILQFLSGSRPVRALEKLVFRVIAVVFIVFDLSSYFFHSLQGEYSYPVKNWVE